MLTWFINLNESFQLLDMLKFYTGFEINDQTGNALTENEMTTIHYDRITSLQVSECSVPSMQFLMLLVDPAWNFSFVICK